GNRFFVKNKRQPLQRLRVIGEPVHYCGRREAHPLMPRAVTLPIVTFEGGPFNALFVEWVFRSYSKSHISKTGLCGAPTSKISVNGKKARSELSVRPRIRPCRVRRLSCLAWRGRASAPRSGAALSRAGRPSWTASRTSRLGRR